MSVSKMLFDSRTLFAPRSPWAARGELLLGKLFVRKVIFASLLCIMRQLYIVSYLDFRRGKCAVIYCFANGRATFTFTCTRDTRSFLFHLEEHTRLLRSEYPLRHFAFLSYFASRCCLFECLARRGPSSFSTHGTRLVSRSIKHCRGGYEISIFPLLLLLCACIVFCISIYVGGKIGLGDKISAKNNKGGKTERY